MKSLCSPLSEKPDERIRSRACQLVRGYLGIAWRGVGFRDLDFSVFPVPSECIRVVAQEVHLLRTAGDADPEAELRRVQCLSLC